MKSFSLIQLRICAVILMLKSSIKISNSQSTQIPTSDTSVDHSELEYLFINYFNGTWVENLIESNNQEMESDPFGTKLKVGLSILKYEKHPLGKKPTVKEMEIKLWMRRGLSQKHTKQA